MKPWKYVCLRSQKLKSMRALANTQQGQISNERLQQVTHTWCAIISHVSKRHAKCRAR